MKASVGVVDKEFACNITGKYAKFSINRALTNLRKRILASLNRVEFVYALPLIVVKRNMLFLKRIGTTRSMKQIRNLLSFRFDSKFISYLQDFPSFWLVNFSLDRFLSDKSTQTPSSGKIKPERQVDRFSEGILLYGPRAAFSSLMKGIRHANLGIISSFAKQFADRRIRLDKTGVMRSAGGSNVYESPPFVRRATYSMGEQTYPTREYVWREFPRIMSETRERVVEKAMTSQHQVQPLTIDVARLSEQIYQLLERRIRIERERRGL